MTSSRENAVKEKVLSHFRQFTNDQKSLNAIWTALKESAELVSEEAYDLAECIAADFSEQHRPKAIEFANELMESWRLDYLDRPLIERMMEVSNNNLDQEDY